MEPTRSSRIEVSYKFKSFDGHYKSDFSIASGLRLIEKKFFKGSVFLAENCELYCNRDYPFIGKYHQSNNFIALHIISKEFVRKVNV